MAKHYYIGLNLGAGLVYTELFPSNDPEATQRKTVGTQIWREEVDEIKLAKTNNVVVYDVLHANFVDKTKFDDEVEIEIYEGTKATGVLYWKGLFSISDTKDDFEYTALKLNPLRINDDYRTILEKSDIQFELDVATTILDDERIGYSEPLGLDVVWQNGTIGTAFDTLVAASGVISTASAGAGPGYEAYVPISTGLTLDDIVVIDVSTFNSNTTPTFDIMYGAGNSMTDEGPKPIATGLLGYTISTGQGLPRVWFQAPPGDTTDVNFSLRVVHTDNDKQDAGALLMTFLEEFITSLSYMRLTGYTGNVLSTFLDNDALPTGAPSSISTFIGANANGNYVTETTDNEMNNTILGLLNEWFDLAEPPSFKLSLNEIMKQLKECLQIDWFIDADGKFRVEHEKYFVKQVDDSTPIVLDAQDEVDAQEMVYNKTGIASVEQFSWAQAANQDFIGRDIVYNNFETTNQSVEHAVNYITTDITYVIENIDDASSNGLALYNCGILTGITGDDMYEIQITTGALTSAAISNAAFSWANLHEKYWRWSRMSENATINSVATAMNSSIRFLEQADVRFYHATAIDPYTMITAELTGGAPIEISRSLETDFVSVILGFDPYKL